MTFERNLLENQTSGNQSKSTGGNGLISFGGTTTLPGAFFVGVRSCICRFVVTMQTYIKLFIQIALYFEVCYDLLLCHVGNNLGVVSKMGQTLTTNHNRPHMVLVTHFQVEFSCK